MASNASSSSSSASISSLQLVEEEERSRPQAGPLPQKRGEIGFRESLHQQQESEQSSDVALPARHPADRDESTAPTSGNSQRSDETSTSTRAAPSPAASSQKKRNNAISRLQQKLSKLSYGGIATTTFFRFFAQLAFLGVSIALWVIVIKRLNARESQSTSTDLVSFGGSGSIFVHVAFGVAVLGQLLFLERCIFVMRAQRYNYLHPNSGLPFHGRTLLSASPPRQVGMGFAPWNRPPLPTYAAALAQSGLGTGDVEDNQIAIPPPPAYGNTRGSTLLLAGFLRESLRRELPVEDRDERRASQARSSRPVSYRSRDEDWEERCDAQRALKLAETLARLEEGSSTLANAASSSGQGRASSDTQAATLSSVNRNTSSADS